METEILENRKVEVEEESSLLTKIIVSKSFEWINNECLVAIIKKQKTDFCNDLSDKEISGKTLLEWVKMATCGPEQHVLEDLAEMEIIEKLRNISLNKSYVFLCYSDTPYLQRSTFCKIMDYFSTSNLNALELPRGFVFKTQYLQTMSYLSSFVKKMFEPKDFNQIIASKDLTDFFEFTQNKIRDFHKRNGVTLFGEGTIFIDADVEIGKGTTIYPNNVLKGKTSVGENVILKSGNTINESIIGDFAQIEGSFIFKSKVSKDKQILPLTKLNGECV